MIMKSDPKLSTRGAFAAAPENALPIWEIISNLWHPKDNPDGFVSLGVAENSLMHKELLDYINSSFNLQPHGLTYGDGPAGSKQLCQALARFINRHFAPVVPVEPAHVAATAGVTTAIEACAWALADAGDGMMLGRPHYGSFPSDWGTRAGLQTVAVSFGDVDPVSLEGVKKYEEALLAANGKGVKVKGLMLCSPHNPLGRCYSREVIVEIMKLCQRHEIHLISDEVYALSVWENKESPNATPFTSVLSIDLAGIIDPNLVHVLWGMSKDFGANGLRLGCIISQHNAPFMAAIRTNALFHYAPSASDHIAINILNNDSFVEHYIQTNRSRIAENYQFAVGFLKEKGIPFKPGTNAAFFLWVDLRASSRKGPSLFQLGELGLETEPIGMKINRNLIEKKVFLASGEAFGTEESGWFRIVFTQPRVDLEEGLKRMMLAIGK